MIIHERKYVNAYILKNFVAYCNNRFIFVKRSIMNSFYLVLFGLLFLLVSNNTISLTQALLLGALLTTTNCLCNANATSL